MVLRVLWVQGQTGTNILERPTTTVSGGSHVENKARDNDKQFSIFLPLTSYEHCFTFPELQFQYRCGFEASISLFLMADINTRQC